MTVTLPWPPAALSGHNESSWYTKRSLVKKYREAGAWATRAALPIDVPSTGDIRIHFRFVPPDRRGDRVNMPTRLKPLIDGIADALGVNDVRFLPSYEFAEPEKPGRVEVTFA